MRRILVSLILTPALIGGCAAAASSTPSPTPQATPSTLATASAPAATPVASKGPPVAQFALVGTAGLTGPVTTTTILCDRPSLDGPEIFYTGQAGTDGPSIVIFLRAGFAEVRVGTGSASTLRERDFTGTGVTGFDAATGAQLDTTLTETTAAGTATGTLGALTSISGSIDCGNQQAGTANVVVTGSTPFGQLAGALTGVEVDCTIVGSAEYVGVVGLSTAGTTPVLLFVTGSTGLLTVTVETRDAGLGFQGKGPALVTLGSGGAQMAGDLAAQVVAGATPSPYTLHVTGDATCGATTQQ